MSPFEIGVLGFAALILISLLGVHVGFSLIMIGFVGFAYMVGIDVSLSNLAIVAFRNVCSYNFAVLPLFLLVSAFVDRSGMGSDAYKSCRAWFGQIRGGLAFATIAGSGLFAATTGSSLAATVAIALFSFLSPMLGVRRRLIEERDEELEKTRGRLRMHIAAAPTIRVDSADSLADLLAWEQRLEAARVWPIDARALGRFAFYVALGLSSWIGAALFAPR